jgi:hypothetical protein
MKKFALAVVLLVAAILPPAWADDAQKLNEQLLQAVTGGAPFASSTVSSLLQEGADPNYKDASGKSLVDYAKKQHPKDVLIELLNAGAHISFEDWLYAYANSLSMQHYYTKLPFTYTIVPKNSSDKITQQYDRINYFGLNLPIMPNKNLVKIRNWNFTITQRNASTMLAYLLDHDKKLLAEYVFIQDAPWKLQEITLHHVGNIDFFSRNWLEKIFQGVKDCGPNSSGLNYDPKTQQSTELFMEKHGYSKPRLVGRDDNPDGEPFAIYEIQETFFGLPAIELSIPGDRFEYTVTVRASAQELARAVRAHTGENIVIYQGNIPEIYENEDLKLYSGAYIFAPDNERSYFQCAGELGFPEKFIPDVDLEP